MLKDLHDHVVLKVACKWNDIAVQLLKADQHHNIGIVKSNHPQNAEECCKRIFEIWLGTSTDATWNQLITALTSPCVGLHYVASQLSNYIGSMECKIYRNTAFVYNHRGCRNQILIGQTNGQANCITRFLVIRHLIQVSLRCLSRR